MKRVLATALVALLYVGLIGGLGGTASAEVTAGEPTAAGRHSAADQVDDAPGFRDYLRRCRRLMSDDTPADDAAETCRQLWQRWCTSHPDSRICHRPSPPTDCRIIDRLVVADEISDTYWKKCGDSFKRWCTAHPEKCRDFIKRWCETHPEGRLCTPTEIDPPDCRITDRLIDRTPDRMCPVPIDPAVDPPQDPPADIAPDPKRCVVQDGVTVCRVPIDIPDCEATGADTDRLCRAPLDKLSDEPIRQPVTDPPAKEATDAPARDVDAVEKGTRRDDIQVRVPLADL